MPEIVMLAAAQAAALGNRLMRARLRS